MKEKNLKFRSKTVEIFFMSKGLKKFLKTKLGAGFEWHEKEFCRFQCTDVSHIEQDIKVVVQKGFTPNLIVNSLSDPLIHHLIEKRVKDVEIYSCENHFELITRLFLHPDAHILSQWKHYLENPEKELSNKKLRNFLKDKTVFVSNYQKALEKWVKENWEKQNLADYFIKRAFNRNEFVESHDEKGKQCYRLKNFPLAGISKSSRDDSIIALGVFHESHKLVGDWNEVGQSKVVELGARTKAAIKESKATTIWEELSLAHNSIMFGETIPHAASEKEDSNKTGHIERFGYYEGDQLLVLKAAPEYEDNKKISFHLSVDLGSRSKVDGSLVQIEINSLKLEKVIKHGQADWTIEAEELENWDSLVSGKFQWRFVPNDTKK